MKPLLNWKIKKGFLSKTTSKDRQVSSVLIFSSTQIPVLWGKKR